MCVFGINKYILFNINILFKRFNLLEVNIIF